MIRYLIQLKNETIQFLKKKSAFIFGPTIIYLLASGLACGSELGLIRQLRHEENFDYTDNFYSNISPPVSAGFDGIVLIKTNIEKRFVSHVQNANKIEVPMPTSIPWALKMGEVQAYCQRLASAIFQNSMNIKIKEPEISVARDGRTKSLSLLSDVFPSCGEKYGSEIFAIKRSLQREVAAVSAYRPPLWNKDVYYKNGSYFVWVESLAKFSKVLKGDQNIFFMKASGGDACPSEGGGAGLVVSNQARVLPRTNFLTFLDDEPTAISFGSYEPEEDGSNSGAYLGERAGKVGQKFVFATGIFHGLFDDLSAAPVWAPPVEERHLGDNHLITCVMNFE